MIAVSCKREMQLQLWHVCSVQEICVWKVQVILTNFVQIELEFLSKFSESPPLEAPSPEGTPPDLNLDGSDNG